MEYLKQAYLGKRARHTIHITSKMGADSEVLSIFDVERILRCSVDTVRRIPRTELPARDGPGKHLLYLRSDVLRYVAARPVAGASVGPEPDEIFEPRPRARGAVTQFNPSEFVRQRRERRA